MLGAVDDFLAIVRPEGAAVITQLVGELLHTGAVGIHGVDVQVAVAGGREHDVLAVPGGRGLGILAAERGVANMAKMLGLFRDRRSADGCRCRRSRISNYPTTEQAGGGYWDERQSQPIHSSYH